MLELQDLSLRVDAETHLDQVSIQFEQGQLTTLLGRTGAGKTTLMRIIAGLVEPACAMAAPRGDGDTAIHQLPTSVCVGQCDLSAASSGYPARNGE